MYNKSNLSKLESMGGLAPEVMTAFWTFDRAAVAEAAIPVKYKELIAVGVALTTQCPYCIDVHAGNARKAGAIETELAEAAMVAAALRAGAAVVHATHVLTDNISGFGARVKTLGFEGCVVGASGGVNDNLGRLG
jgi:AhpD family alkylhydroperoxidase